jgi:hypothetical protein
MAVFTLFDSVIRDLMNGVIDLHADVFKMALTNVAPDAANNEVFGSITEIAAGNGYLAGGLTLAGLAVTETGPGTGIWQWTFDDATFTAVGGSIGPFRWTVVYDFSVALPAMPLVGYLDYGVATTLTAGNIFTVAVGASGVLRAQEA